MAENESLDLKSPNAMRWFAVLKAARDGASAQKVGSIARERYQRAMQKVQRQFEKYGVTTADFVNCRNSPQELRKLLRQAKGHEYAELFISVLQSNPSAPATECLSQWGHAVLDKMFDQIGHSLAGSERFQSFPQTRSFFRHVRQEVRADIERIAIELAKDPRARISARTSRGVPKADTTAELLPMSLVGGPK